MEKHRDARSCDASTHSKNHFSTLNSKENQLIFFDEATYTSFAIGAADIPVTEL